MLIFVAQLYYHSAFLVECVVGLVVRISAFQADGPGSIPGQRTILVLYCSVFSHCLGDSFCAICLGSEMQKLRWSSGYDACFTRRRSAVRSRHEVHFYTIGICCFAARSVSCASSESVSQFGRAV